MGNGKSKATQKFQFSSVAQSCPTFCDPMVCSMPGFPVHHQLPEPVCFYNKCCGDTDYNCINSIPTFSERINNSIQLFNPQISSVQFSSVQLLSRVPLFATPWTAAFQASLSITNSQRLLKLMYIESVMPSNHLTFCSPLLLPLSIFPRIKVFSNESVLCIR